MYVIIYLTYRNDNLTNMEHKYKKIKRSRKKIKVTFIASIFTFITSFIHKGCFITSFYDP